MLMVPGAISATGTGVGTAVVSVSIGVTLTNTGASSEKGVGVGVGVSAGVAVGLGVKVAGELGVGASPATLLGMGVLVEEGGEGTGLGVAGSSVGGGRVGASVGSVKTGTGLPLTSTTPSNTPRTTQAKVDAIHLPRVMLTLPCPTAPIHHTPILTPSWIWRKCTTCQPPAGFKRLAGKNGLQNAPLLCGSIHFRPCGRLGTESVGWLDRS